MRELEPFLDFEKAFERVIARLWEAELQTAGPALERAAQVGDTLETDRILSQLDLTDALAKKMPQVRVLMEASLLFGASIVSDGRRKPAITADQMAMVVEPAMALFENMATFSLNKLAQRRVAQAVSLMNAEPEIELLVRKSAPDGSNPVTDVAKGVGRMIASIAANMTTSRLVNYGALFELHASGVALYRLEATLDSRTSAICRRMHGKTFEVASTLTFMEKTLRITDPEDMKLAAPWLSGNKDMLRWIEGASGADLRAAGFPAPPFHPVCRTVVRRESDVTVTGFEYTPLTALVAVAAEVVEGLFAKPTPE